MERWLFIGSPGSGKSTMANCFLGQPVFRSGLCFGNEGVTTQLQSRMRNGVVYMDTPGITMLSTSRYDASETTKALRQSGGPFKLIFVINLRYGRALAEDVAIMNAVLKSLGLSNPQFAVLVNQVGHRQYREIQRGDAACKAVVASICSGSFATPYIGFVPVLDALDENDNTIVSLPQHIICFLRDMAPCQFVDPLLVRDIEVRGNSIEEEMSEVRTMINRYTNNSNLAMNKIESLNRSERNASNKSPIRFWDILVPLLGYGVEIFLNFMPN